MNNIPEQYVRWFSEQGIDDVELVGGTCIPAEALQMIFNINDAL